MVAPSGGPAEPSSSDRRRVMLRRLAELGLTDPAAATARYGRVEGLPGDAMHGFPAGGTDFELVRVVFKADTRLLVLLYLADDGERIAVGVEPEGDFVSVQVVLPGDLPIGEALARYAVD